MIRTEHQSLLLVMPHATNHLHFSSREQRRQRNLRWGPGLSEASPNFRDSFKATDPTANGRWRNTETHPTCLESTSQEPNIGRCRHSNSPKKIQKAACSSLLIVLLLRVYQSTYGAGKAAKLAFTLPS